MVFEEGIFSWMGIFILSIVTGGIWIIIEIKRFKHKIFAIILIAFIIFAYVGFVVISQDNNIDLTSVSGVVDATKIYFSWIGSVFVNIKTATVNTIKLDWAYDKKN
tara:strand:- start:26 stop:343 length:318 start_codon:yes stop_codon:yes gene_type:complete